MIEMKPGPFRPAEFADWSASEANSHALASAEWVQSAKIGD